MITALILATATTFTATAADIKGPCDAKIAMMKSVLGKPGKESHWLNPRLNQREYEYECKGVRYTFNWGKKGSKCKLVTTYKTPRCEK